LGELKMLKIFMTCNILAVIALLVMAVGHITAKQLMLQPFELAGVNFDNTCKISTQTAVVRRLRPIDVRYHRSSQAKRRQTVSLLMHFRAVHAEKQRVSTLHYFRDSTLITFGKYNGKTVAQVDKIDKNYFPWILKKKDATNPEIKLQLHLKWLEENFSEPVNHKEFPDADAHRLFTIQALKVDEKNTSRKRAREEDEDEQESVVKNHRPLAYCS